MAEPSKGKSSSADQKKKKSSFLDEEIDDDFLSSWKSTSVMKDDGMDFSFNTGAKSKKKVFDFDKLDMDFNLEGDFNKISSFKMDMSDFDFSSPPEKGAKTKEVDMSDLDLSSPPKKAAKTKEVDMSDLDLSSPPKKAAKTKERSEEGPSRGSHQGKKDHFKFSFDFNDFDLDSTLSIREKSSKNQDGIKEVISDGAGCEGSEVDLADGISTLDAESETVATSKIDTLLVEPGNTISTKDCASKSESFGKIELPPGSGPRCQENIMCNSKEVSNQESHLPEKPVSVEPYAEHTIHDLPAELVNGVGSNADAGVDGKNGGCPQIKKVDPDSSGKEAANDKMLIEDGPDNEELPFKSSCPLDIDRLGSSYGDRSMSESDNSTKRAEPAKGDLNNEEPLATVVSRKTPHDINSIKGTESTDNLKLPLSTQAGKSTVDKVTLRKESGAGAICSTISMKLEDIGPQPHQSSLVGAKSLLSGNNKVGSMYLSPAIEKRVTVNANDAQPGSKLLTTRVLVDKESKVRPTMPGRESSDSDGKLNETKLVGDRQHCDKEIMETEPVAGSEQRQSIKDLRIQVSSSSSTDMTRKHSSQSVKPKIMLPTVESLRNSKISTAEVNKHCPEKIAQKKSDISTWKLSKNIGCNKHSLSAAPQKEVKTQRSSEQNKELHHNVKLDTRQIVEGSEKMPQILPVKRKAFEGLGPGLASLKPLKRLSLSPRETRNSTEPSKGTVEQVCLHEKHSEVKTKSPSSRLGSMVNVLELELPSAMETDESVEKAEACTKELEDICNMLKKKHEEAKELLVRAVVNNNNLLMLNHPIYEAKIHKVHKFATKLASKELQVC